MIRKSIALLLATVLLLSLAGCAGGEKTPPAEETAAPETVTAAPTPTDAPIPAETEIPVYGEDDVGVIVEVGTEAETVTDDDGTELLLFSAALPVVTIPGRETVAEAINRALAEANDLFVNGVPEQEGLSGREEFLDAARNELAMRVSEGYPEYFAPYTLTRDVMAARVDSRVLSLAFTETTYTGGAHGYAGVYGLTFDVRTGKTLTLEDLAEDPEAFLTECTDRLWEVSRDAEHAGYVQGYYPDYEDALPGLLRNAFWYFDADGLTVVANPYELAPYAAGRIYMTLPYEWLRWHMKEEYLPPETAADGELAGEITDDPGSGLVLADDGTGGQGACVVFTARGTVRNLAVSHVTYSEFDRSFGDMDDLLYVSTLHDGESFGIRTWIPDVLPTLAVRYTDGSGRQEYLITQSGMDGSLVLMDRRPFTPLPAEISGSLPFSYDVDRDGENEVIDLVASPDGEGRWSLAVDGTAVGDVFAMDGALSSLWLADLDYNGIPEIIFSGDMGSEDYVTCAWRGDTLQPISFTGESRMGADPEALTPTADGRAVMSAWQLYLESWNYQLGTYRAVRAYSLIDGVITPSEWSDWTYDSNRADLEVKRELPVTMDGGGETFLAPGTVIRLLGTDGDTVRFTAGDGVTGTIELELGGDETSGWTIAGVSENEYFEMLPYVG